MVCFWFFDFGPRSLEFSLLAKVRGGKTDHAGYLLVLALPTDNIDPAQNNGLRNDNGADGCDTSCQASYGDIQLGFICCNREIQTCARKFVYVCTRVYVS